MNRYQLKAYLNFPARDMQELELVARAMRYVETNGTPIDSPIPFEFTQVEPADANSGWRVTLAFHSFTIERNEHAFRRVWSVVKGYVQKAVYSKDGLTVMRAGTNTETWSYAPARSQAA